MVLWQEGRDEAGERDMVRSDAYLKEGPWTKWSCLLPHLLMMLATIVKTFPVDAVRGSSKAGGRDN
jgi:hypothetical protein